MKTIIASAVLAIGLSTTSTANAKSYDNKAIHHKMATITLNLATKYEHKAKVIGDTVRAKWYHREYLRALHILKGG